MRVKPWITFESLAKTFNTVNRDRLWKFLQIFGCPERFAKMVRKFHDGMTVCVIDNRTVSEAFVVTDGVKKGCILLLFNPVFSVMLMEAYCEERPEIDISYRITQKMSNIRRSKV
nr:unnamed protein product [Spirometra erinaceieuropaei]